MSWNSFFSRRVIERWNQLEQHVVDASSINSFKSNLQKIRETRMGFLWIPLNPMSLTCRLTAAEATQGKAQGKAHILFKSFAKISNEWFWCNQNNSLSEISWPECLSSSWDVPVDLHVSDDWSFDMGNADKQGWHDMNLSTHMTTPAHWGWNILVGHMTLIIIG